jgi:hypothetical protein
VRQDLATGRSAELQAALEPLLAEVASLNQRIALTYVLTVENPHRFGRSPILSIFRRNWTGQNQHSGSAERPKRGAVPPKEASATCG